MSKSLDQRILQLNKRYQEIYWSNEFQKKEKMKYSPLYSNQNIKQNDFPDYLLMVGSYNFFHNYVIDKFEDLLAHIILILQTLSQIEEKNLF